MLRLGGNFGNENKNLSQRFIARITLSPSNYTSVWKQLEKGTAVCVLIDGTMSSTHFKLSRRACFLKTSVVLKRTWEGYSPNWHKNQLGILGRTSADMSGDLKHIVKSIIQT